MKCFNHNAVDATATCQDCGKGLCVECSSRFDTILCEPCLLKHNSLVSRQMYVGLALTAVVFIAATYFFSSVAPGNAKPLAFGSATLMGLMLAFTFWGWRFLSDYFPRLSRGSGWTWVMYLTLKFMAACCIGIFVGPYQIFKHFREIYRAHHVKQQLAGGQT